VSKKSRHVITAHGIGDNSYYLMNFHSLPKTATAQEQVDALKNDRRWQEDHTQEVARSIDNLIRDIIDSQPLASAKGEGEK
jgi:hypothetical protein